MNTFFIDPNIARAQTLDSRFYTDPACYELAKERIFVPSWQYIGSSDQLAQAGDTQPLVLLPGCLDEPLLLTCDPQQTLHCLSNVCTHRGNLLVQQACQQKNLTCRYHGRQFALDGRFVSMPQFQGVENFPDASDDLPSLPLFQWGKLLFTSLQPGLDPAPFFAAMQERLAWYPVQDLVLRPELSKSYEVNAHWALYCENYLEGLHIPFVHAGLNAALDFSAYRTEIFEHANLQLGIAKAGDACFELPPSSPDFGSKVAAYYFWVFPNMMFNFYPWGLSFNLVEPLGQSRSKVTFLSWVLDESKLASGAGAGLDTVELEDEAVVENVQKGIRSRLYQSGRYSALREQGPHHFHSLLARFMG